MKIPNHADDPMQILLWEQDEALIFIMVFGLGILINNLTVFLFIGLIAVRGYRRVRDRQPRGIGQHLLYWWFGVGSVKKNRWGSFKNPYIRRWF
ncbi:MAG: type IV conjugative transfer system protein TraL [Magnetococcales bacterium]|nr:type IV conjugative transfer system protein TraL [Magnetococcales bacterium]NGZ25381.1 type IV conjugative transfer system protein TraL [Magnetococcales bacterium]